MDQDPLFDYYAPEFRVDPYAFYRRLREEDPVHWGLPFEPDFEGAWQIARYVDVNAML
jgi:cytochrome P450